MRKTFLMAALMLGLTAFSTNANAGCDGIYLAARGGLVNHNLGNPGETTGDRLDFDENAYMLSGAVGYRWGYFRGELEYIWREDLTEKVKNDPFQSKTEYQTQTYLASVYYDFSPYTMFTPYVGAGVGFSKHEMTFSNVFRKNEIKATEFTWALTGGISAKITNRFNADFGYRFLNMGKVQDATVRAHEFYVGLRYVF